MTIRRMLTLTLVVATALLVGACSDDDGDGGEADEGSGDTSTTEVEEITTTTMSDETFRDNIDSTLSTLESAGGDICTIATATSSLGIPTNPEQVEASVELYVAMYEALADAIQEEDPSGATAFREGVARLAADAEAADYAVDFLLGGEPPEAVNTPEFNAAMGTLQARYAAECATTTTAAG